MAKMLIRSVTLNIDKENYEPIITKQKDTGRYLLFQILDNRVPYALTGRKVRVSAIKKDGSKVFNDLSIIDAAKGICELRLTSQILFYPGWLKMELTIYEGTDTISLIPFTLDIVASIRDAAEIESTNEFSALSTALNQVDVWNSYFEATSGKIEEKYTTRLNKIDASLADIVQLKILNDIENTDYKASAFINVDMLRNKQAELMGDFLRRLTQWQSGTIINCQGDSLTYGSDSYSQDKREFTQILPSGLSHTSFKASTTYPEALQNYLNEVYPNTITTITRAVGGYTVKDSYETWYKKHDAHCTIFMFGTNDSQPDSSIADNINKFIYYYEQLIVRELLWGKAVILIRSPKKKTATSYRLDVYGHVVDMLGEKYGIKVIDGEKFHKNYPSTVYSDAIHFNADGYKILASRLASALIGGAIYNPNRVKHGDKLLTRPTIDNISPTAGCSVGEYSGSGIFGTPSEIGRPIKISMSSGGRLYYSFYADTDDLVIIPNAEFENKIRLELDFCVLNSDNSIDSTLFLANKEGDNNTNVIEYEKARSTKFINSNVVVKNNLGFIRIPTSGWHTICVKSVGNTAYLDGLEILGHDSIIDRINSNSTKYLAKYFLPQEYANPQLEIEQYKININDLPFMPKVEYTSQYRMPIIKFIVHTANESYVEYGFAMPSYNTDSGQKFLGEINRVNIRTPSPQDIIVSNIQYDSVTQDITLIFGGVKNKLFNIIVSIV